MYVPESPHFLLTERELQVLNLVCEGYSTKQVAERLGISFKTAVTHRSNINAKAAVHDPISLFRWAVKTGYISVKLLGLSCWTGMILLLCSDSIQELVALSTDA